MNIGIYIEANILSCLFCVLLYYQQRRHKIFDFLGSTAFNSLLWASILIMLVDTASWFCMGNLIPHTDTHLLLIQTLYYLLQALLPLYFMVYCLNATGKDIPTSLRSVLYIPVLFTLGVLIFNWNSGFAFYVSENYVIRGEGFLLAIVTPMLYLTNSLVLCSIFYFRTRHDTQERRKVSFHMLMCILISFVGALICSVVNYVSPWHIFVASLIYLYIQLHSHREQHLDILAFTDSLTGLKNHAAYSHIRAKMEAKLLEHPDTKFAVAVMDVNKLKQANDVYGHKVGDAMITCASRFMCRIFDHSPVCRIGGDEFVAILENDNYRDRDELQRKFARQIQTLTFSAEGKQFHLSASLGLCEYDPSRHRSFDDVFRDADSAMYEIKSQSKPSI